MTVDAGRESHCHLAFRSDAHRDSQRRGKRAVAEKQSQNFARHSRKTRACAVESSNRSTYRRCEGAAGSDETRYLISLLAQNLPNQARIEMLRISHDRAAQAEVSQTLVKSTTAICTAIGAQPIPLADLPILTTLQLVMVSGIMYLSGRERSLRAATEFMAALGANVGAGMLLREGTRAVLKFFPGLGQCRLRHGGRCRNLCDWPRCDRLFR